MVTCGCGNTYDDNFKFCPECGTPNTQVQPKQDGQPKERPARMAGFQKIGESRPVRAEEPVKVQPAEEYYEDEPEDQAPAEDTALEQKEEYYEDIPDEAVTEPEEEFPEEEYYEDDPSELVEEEIEEYDVDPAKALPPIKKPGLKRSSDYDPNHDGYYDDRLPKIAEEMKKTSHLDLILKGIALAVAVFAIIVYLIYRI